MLGFNGNILLMEPWAQKEGYNNLCVYKFLLLFGPKASTNGAWPILIKSSQTLYFRPE